MIRTIKTISVAVAFLAAVALCVLGVAKLATLLPWEWAVPAAALLYAIIVFAVMEVLERSR